MKAIGKRSCCFLVHRDDYKSIGAGREAIAALLDIRLTGETVKINYLETYVKIATGIIGLHGSQLNFFPISLGLILWHEQDKTIGAVARQGTGIDIGFVVQLLEHCVNFGFCRWRHVGTTVQHPVNRTNRHTGTLGNILDSNLL